MANRKEAGNMVTIMGRSTAIVNLGDGRGDISVRNCGPGKCWLHIDAARVKRKKITKAELDEEEERLVEE